MSINEDRFWKKVDKSAGPSGCWLWTAGRMTAGYGQFGVRDVNGKLMPRLAHRVSYVLENGELPKDVHIMHACDNILCVNPGHLVAGTNADNMADKLAKGRQRNCVLSEEDVRVIRIMAKLDISHGEIADIFGITHMMSYRAIHGKSHKNCPEPPVPTRVKYNYKSDSSKQVSDGK